MANAQQELIEAEVNLNRATAAAAEEERAANIEAYKRAKRQGRAVQDAYNAVVAQHGELNGQIAQKELALRSLGEELQAHSDANPEQDDFATDEEIEAWLAQREKLRAKHWVLGEQLGGLIGTRDRLKLEGVKLGQQLEYHRHVVRNLKNKIDDPKSENAVRGWVGGLSGVV